MAQKVTQLRIVLASPSDVTRERDAFAKVVAQVDNDTAHPAGFRLELWRWETDSRPGFNPMGPQGLIDKELRIAQCDLFVGIFWNRIGSPTKFGKTGTEHEFETAYKAWKRKGTQDIMFYFNEKPSNLTSESEIEQRRKVLGFRSGFPEEGLYWPFRGPAEFTKYTNDHLRKFVHEQVARGDGKGEGRRRGAEPGAGSGAIAKSGETFTLKIGRRGAVAVPVTMLSLLGLSEGDHLELRVLNRRIVSGVGVPSEEHDEVSLMKRSGSKAVGVTPGQVSKVIAKGRRNA
jgi:bifunctional DNA-binding transcriptional regulator/antitoxin component of YhaV-PrlF toxin-antitoxin module